MRPERTTFAGFPPEDINRDFSADIAIIGIPYGVSYQPGVLSPSHHAPAAIRSESMRYPEDINSWDFDLNGTLLADSSLKVVDVGDLDGDAHDPEGNRKRGMVAVGKILRRGALPVVLGGDDSIPLMAFEAFQDVRDIQILQIDAHIDWRDEVGGITDGFSSPMRRASELPWIRGITQVGARGTGTARRQEYEHALAYGSRIISSYDLHRFGAEHALESVQENLPCFVTIDCDGLDPACMPAVMSPAPGGVTYYQLLDLLSGVHQKAGLAGLCMVEFVPNKDINHFGAVTAMRTIWYFIGQISRENKRDK